jgi:hypothetical protein
MPEPKIQSEKKSGEHEASPQRSLFKLQNE